MRHSFTDLAIVAIAAVALVVLVRIGRDGDDPAWEERWGDLDPAERTRIAAAARSGALLPSQEDIELAAGFARRDRRQNGPWTLVNVIRLLLGVALIARGLVASSIILLVFGVFFLLGSLWALRAFHRVAHAEREAIARDRTYRSCRRWRSSGAISAIVAIGRSRRSSQPSRGIRYPEAARARFRSLSRLPAAGLSWKRPPSVSTTTFSARQRKSTS
jgi:hypothetical protein